MNTGPGAARRGEARHGKARQGFPIDARHNRVYDTHSQEDRMMKLESRPTDTDEPRYPTDTRWHRVPGIARFRVADGRLYVFCAGSRGAADWRRNLQLRRVARGRVRVNREDYREALELANAIGEAGIYPMVEYADIVGYSRGGAIALILAGLLGLEYAGVRSRNLPHEITLFAPKRAGDARLVNVRIHAADAVYAGAYPGDVVPWLPPWPWYRQVEVIRRGPSRIIDRLPWRAHRMAARDAARLRHGMGEL